ncbi:sugar phosphate isomerase/epimerase [Novosphingobium sp. G106]|uniref:sugar phosphate isomerase/epimerase family protein n=1 Tax=Novosphingobium sp. G106 TaxID=2849500 RepID=UPI001C2CF6F3|nr:TIM barrel protein [Novosphingobium sp. G106]MBV1688908.1 sugar phosphate isomerase/epimerase [Novosphingobium sp. G106]
MRTISLDQLTVCGERPAELVEIAASAGYGAISCMLDGNAEVPAVSLHAGDPDTTAMRKRLRDTGVFINVADGFPLSPVVSMERLREGVDLMAEMGARKIVTLNFDPDPARSFDSFCTLREWCQAANLPLLIEFTPLSQIASLADALAFRGRAGADGVGVLVDLLHLNQSGGSPADIACLGMDVIGGGQLCDGPLRSDMETYLYNAIYERGVPGEGELPVREFLRSLPEALVFGLEVPMRSRALAGASAMERALLLMNVTRSLLAAEGL